MARVTPNALVIVGCGRIAVRHAAAARRLRIPLIAASRDIARARSFARDHGAVAAYGSYQDAYRDPGAAGAVLCTPHDRHLADAEAALAAGLHVLVEKPIARTLDEAGRMVASAAAAGRVLMVAENFHFMPAFRRVRAVVDSGGLGALREVHLAARGWRPPADWRCEADVAGGGALIDGGIHYVHTLRCWGGPVRRVFALRPPQTHARLGGEDSVQILAELASGAVGVLSNSLAAPGFPRVQWSTVTGTRATCFADNRGRLIAIRDGGGRLRVSAFVRDTRGHQAMLRAFQRAIARGCAEEMDGAAGRDDLAVVLAAYRSIATGQPVALADDRAGVLRC
jgi:predicted dehydrogenase